MDDEEIARLKEDHAVAYFRGEMVADCPGDYTVEEMKEIYEGMVESTKQVEAAMKEDFKSFPPEGQAKMLDMLVNSGVETPEYWRNLLLGD